MVFYLNFLFSLGASLAADLKFFVFSDIHVDILYKENYSKEFQCHQESIKPDLDVHPTPTDDIKPIGRFGCDPPIRLIESAFNYAKSINKDPDFIIITGDFIGHYTAIILTDSNQYLPLYNMEMIFATYSQIMQSLKELFPNTKIIPVIGNNDGYHDYQVPKGIDGRILMDFLYGIFSELVEIPEEFLTGGYYSIVVASYEVVVLNTNYFNVWGKEDNEAEAMEELSWLDRKLKSSMGGVILTMHIPPGINIYQFGSVSWKREYTKIISEILIQNKDKIDFIFTGHFHSGLFEIIEGLDVGIFVNPAISPIFGANPGFRYYTVVGNNRDYIDYHLNLYDGETEWREQYRFSEFFGLETFNMQDIYKQLSEDQEKLESYLLHSYNLGQSTAEIEYYWGLIFQSKFTESSTRGFRAALCSFEYIDPLDYERCIEG